MKPRLAVLASGNGTTAEALIQAGLRGEMQATIDLVITNRPDAGILERVARLNKTDGLAIECLVISSSTHPARPDETVAPGAQTAAEEAAIIETLSQGNFDLIALLGYMKRVGPRLVHTFGWRPEYQSAYQVKMVNTHPGLLPETKGLYGIHVQRHVLDKHLSDAGQTLHAVAENYDEGPVIAEHRIKVLPDDTAESLFERVKATEKQYLPKDIENFIQKRQAFIAQNKENATWQKS
jgi:phosphoribosylglycinamide formyltransferase 1